MPRLIRALLLGLVRLLVGAHARWQGCGPSDAARIYFANHSSHLDTLVILAALPRGDRDRTHPVAARDYWSRSPARRFLAERCLGAVLVERKPHGAADPLDLPARALAAGESLILFPEGTRGEGAIAPFRGGLFHLARRFPHVELVPVHVENLHRVLPKGSLLLVPLLCTLTVGAPLALMPGETKPAFLERARAALAGLAEPHEATEHGR
ncbi:MAG: lysophospholipid acyltransferase family protein [Alphaproteobacteria bacterium]